MTVNLGTKRGNLSQALVATLQRMQRQTRQVISAQSLRTDRAVREIAHQVAHGFVVGDVVSYDGGWGKYTARPPWWVANTGTYIPGSLIGLVTRIFGPNMCEVTTWGFVGDFVPDATHPIAVNGEHWASETVGGAFTATKNATGQRVFIAGGVATVSGALPIFVCPLQAPDGLASFSIVATGGMTVGTVVSYTASAIALADASAGGMDTNALAVVTARDGAGNITVAYDGYHYLASFAAAAEGRWYLDPAIPGALTHTKPTADKNAYLTLYHLGGGLVRLRPPKGEADRLTTLGDVAVSTPSDAQSLVYESATKLWKARKLALNEHSDTNLGTPSNGYVIAWDAATGKWISTAAGGGGATALSALTDVALASPADKDFLRYDAGTSKWKNVALGDLNYTVSNDRLAYNGASFGIKGAHRLVLDADATLEWLYQGTELAGTDKWALITADSTSHTLKFKDDSNLVLEWITSQTASSRRFSFAVPVEWKTAAAGSLWADVVPAPASGNRMITVRYVSATANTIRIYWGSGAGNYWDIETTATGLRLTSGGTYGHRVSLNEADIPGTTQRDLTFQELDFCQGGVAKKILLLAAVY